MKTKLLLAFMLLATPVFGQQNPIQIDANGLTQTLASGGLVSRGQIVKINSAGQVVPMAVTDTSGAIGVAATSQQNQGQSITVSIAGTPLILVDGTCTAGNLVLISSTASGSGHCSANAQGQQIGIALSASSPGSNFWNVQLSPNSAGSAGNPDPPVSQNYTVTATGAQTSINLTAAPIDTHSIQWRLSPGTLTPLIDTVTYSNGDLHASNANWVYQTGTFNVNAGAIYGSAASSLAYRNDGANTANEFAQATVVETVGNATQNHGPCVRVQTGAQTAYCLQVATDILRLVYENAGGFTQLASFDNTLAVTGDVLKLQVAGTLLSVFKNGVLLGTANDSNLTTGLTGLYSAGNANSNGVSNFQSAALPSCTVALDSSTDGVTFTSGGVISGQFCGSGAGQFTATQAIANYVRVNVTALTAGQTLTVVYSGRLAGAPPTGNNSINNGFFVQPGQALWAQFSSVLSVTNFNPHLSVRIANGNSPNSITTTNWDPSGCSSSAGGTGSGLLITQPGWLQAFTADVNGGNIPQGQLAINLYVLNVMPPGGGTASCSNTLTIAQIGSILGTWPAGSFYPVGFVGTSGQYTHPWAIPGYTTVISPANPAAGAEWSSTITTAGRTCIQSVSFTVAAGSTNITPALQLKFSVGGNTHTLTYSGATAQTSATTQNYSFSPGAAAEVVTGQASPNTIHIVPFNNGQLACFNGGFTTGTVGTLTNGLNGTTAYTAITILVQQQNDNN